MQDLYSFSCNVFRVPCGLMRLARLAIVHRLRALKLITGLHPPPDDSGFLTACIGLLVIGLGSSLMTPRVLNSLTIVSISSTAPGFSGYCLTGGCTPPYIVWTYLVPKSPQSFLNLATLAATMICLNFSFPSGVRSLSLVFCLVTSGTSTRFYHPFAGASPLRDPNLTNLA